MKHPLGPEVLNFEEDAEFEMTLNHLTLERPKLKLANIKPCSRATDNDWTLGFETYPTVMPFRQNNQYFDVINSVRFVANNRLSYRRTKDESATTLSELQDHLSKNVRYQWQCVEFARRWLLMRKSCTFKDIPCAFNIWDELPYIERVTDGRHFPLCPVPNGSPKPPKKDSLLIYPRSRKMPYGHVSVITDVVSGYVHIAEQNNLCHYWPGDYARRAPLRFHQGAYYIDDGDKIYGWMEIENNDQLQPFVESDIDSIREQYLHP
ncbi:unnamed protein product [Didymodactylos carnosus]|uniref:Peptidase C51 domain-containing protein n=1 Tax=Didymodactylos carnosus TaxID=1234261 RepID=A0A814VHZ7_9BILA|nr:unnamed protein product [Didymodactylos carnosus]CAF3953449.1 unnamed protein product [Didymodactylos carnosus]